jgi:hypothetical protein
MKKKWVEYDIYKKAANVEIWEGTFSTLKDAKAAFRARYKAAVPPHEFVIVRCTFEVLEQ